MRILIIEDDAILADGLMRSLGQSGYAVDHVAHGEDADHMLTFQTYDLAILDLGLPKLNGFEVLKRLRQRHSQTPVLILTARDGVTDRVNGLDLGADDYLTKPFNLIELEARIRALIRRGQSGGSAQLELGRLMLDTAGRLATVNGQSLDLSARELAVLEILMLKIGRVVNKEQIMERLCNWEDDIGDNAIEVYVHRLRKKLKGSDIEIKTIRGLGYLLEKPVTREHASQ
jgi:two-component system OmpR family response regulator